MPADQIFRRRRWTLGVLSLALLVISLDNTILNVALPSIDRDLHASSGQLQWIVDAYMLVFAGLLLAAGALGDRFGRRRALGAGLTIFAVGSALSALSGSPTALIASRAVMGIGGALIMPSTLSILTNVFPAHERGRAIGVWAAVSGLGIAIGPVAGGWLLEQFSWSAVFYINLPVALAALALLPALVPESRDPEATPLDPVGAGLSIAGFTVLVWGIIEASSRGWTDGTILAAFGAAVVLLGAFAAWELHARFPMLDIRLFRNRRFSAASVSVSLVFFALMGVIFFLTQYLQSVMGYSALAAGVRVIPVAAGLMLAAPLSARLTERVGAKIVVGGGLTVVAAALGLLSTATVTSGYGLVAASLALMGLGMGAAMAPATDSIMGSLPLAKASVGSAMNDTTRMVGGALGVAVLGSILSSNYGADMQPAVRDLPGPAAHTASDGVGGAAQVAQQIGGSAGRALTQAANSAFVSAMDTTLMVAAAVALVGALVALLFLPARERQATAEPAQPGRLVPAEVAA